MARENYYNPELKMMNYFIEEAEERPFHTEAEKINEAILKDFHKAVNWLLGRQYEEYRELQSNTINPAQQNAFLPLRTYRVRRNGHYKLVSIYHRFWGGCLITEEAY